MKHTLLLLALLVGCDGRGCSTIPLGFFAGPTGPMPPLPGLANWVKSDAGVTKDGSNNVTAWADQSGHGRNWTEVNLYPARVVWTANVKNGLPALSVDGNNGATNHNCLKVAPFRSGSDTGEILVVILGGPTGGGVANYSWGGFGSYSATTGHYVYSDGTWYEFFGITSRPAISNIGQGTAATWAIIDISVDSGASNYIARRNNSTLSTSSQTIGWRDGTAGNLFVLFAATDNSCSGSFPWTGGIGEILFYDHVLSSSDRSAAYSYLSTKWAIP